MSEDEYAKQFEAVCERMALGTDATEFVLNFWEKVVKIEKSYAESIDDLCSSRTAKLARFMKNTSTEHVEELNEAWTTTVDDLKQVAVQHREAADFIYKEICAPLFKFHSQELPKQAAHLVSGRRVLKDLKQEKAKLQQEERRYRRACRDAILKVHNEKARREALPDQSAEGDFTAFEQQVQEHKERDAQQYQKAWENYRSLHNQAFTIALPGLLKEIKDIELQRVELIKKSVVQSTEVVAEKSVVSFSAAIEKMTGVQPDMVHSCDIDVEVSVPAELGEPTEEELFPEGLPDTGHSKAPVAASTATAAAAAAEPTEAPASSEPEPPQETTRGFFANLFGLTPKKPSRPDGDTDSRTSDKVEEQAAAEAEATDAPQSQASGEQAAEGEVAPEETTPAPAASEEQTAQPEAQQTDPEPEPKPEAEEAVDEQPATAQEENKEEDVKEEAKEESKEAPAETEPATTEGADAEQVQGEDDDEEEETW